jgi:hypothetical protein
VRNTYYQQFFPIGVLHNFNIALKKQQSSGLNIVMDQYPTSRKVETMLATTKSKRENTWGIGQEARWTTYLPSPLILQLFLENGWKIARIELVPSEDQLGLVYLVTLQSDSRQPNRQVVLPRNSLVEKILEDHAKTAVPANAGLLTGELLSPL